MKTKLMVANGIFISKLSYLISLWGGCEGFLIKALQIMQNKAARCVTGLGWFTPTNQLLARCNWLSVKQMIFYHTVLQAHVSITSGAPRYFKEKLGNNFPYQTRLSTSGGIRFADNFDGKKSLSHQSFFYRAVRDYNSIPGGLRSIKIIPKFKTKLKEWIRSNIALS